MIRHDSMLDIAPPLFVVYCEVPLKDDSRGKFFRFRVDVVRTLEEARKVIAEDRKAMGTDSTGGLIGHMSQKEIAQRKYVIWKSKEWEKIE